MTRFAYKAYGRAGDLVDGTIDALSEAEALGKLHARGLMPFETNAGTEHQPASRFWHAAFGSRRLSLNDRAQITMQLAELLRAGIALDRALRLLALQPSSARAGTHTEMPGMSRKTASADKRQIEVALSAKGRAAFAELDTPPARPQLFPHL